MTSFFESTGASFPARLSRWGRPPAETRASVYLAAGCPNGADEREPVVTCRPRSAASAERAASLTAAAAPYLGWSTPTPTRGAIAAVHPRRLRRVLATCCYPTRRRG